jgi:hypothetical protein
MPTEAGEPERWMQLRDKNERFKSGERRKLYEVHAQAQASGLPPQIQELTLLRHMASHLVHSWSLSVPPPRAVMTHGDVLYEHMESLDELDVDMENELFAVCLEWVNQIAISFKPSPDSESPTGPSAG